MDNKKYRFTIRTKNAIFYGESDNFLRVFYIALKAKYHLRNYFKKLKPIKRKEYL
jgi:hypothetical protein